MSITTKIGQTLPFVNTALIAGTWVWIYQHINPIKSGLCELEEKVEICEEQCESVRGLEDEVNHLKRTVDDMTDEMIMIRSELNAIKKSSSTRSSVSNSRSSNRKRTAVNKESSVDDDIEKLRGKK